MSRVHQGLISGRSCICPTGTSVPRGASYVCPRPSTAPGTRRHLTRVPESSIHTGGSRRLTGGREPPTVQHPACRGDCDARPPPTLRDPRCFTPYPSLEHESHVGYHSHSSSPSAAMPNPAAAALWAGHVLTGQPCSRAFPFAQHCHSGLLPPSDSHKNLWEASMGPPRGGLRGALRGSVRGSTHPLAWLRGCRGLLPRCP